MKKFILLTKLFLRDLARVLFLKKERNQDVTHSEYDQLNWRAQLDQQQWQNYADARSYYIGKSDVTFFSNVQHHIIEISRREYYKQRADWLVGVLRDYAQYSDRIVEIGCGTGMLTCLLAEAFKTHRFVGFDFSSNGLTVAGQSAKHFQLNNAEFRMGDMSQASSPMWSELSEAIVLTHFAIEQVPQFASQVIEQIATAKPALVIHFEPDYHHQKLGLFYSLLNLLYLKAQDYTYTTLNILRHMEAQGMCKILFSDTLAFSPSPSNLGRLTVWVPA